MFKRKGLNKYSKAKLRSGLEDLVKQNLEDRGIPHEYESIKLKYVKDTCSECGHVIKRGTYTPDFIIVRPSGVRLVVETKGLFSGQDRTKHQRVQRDNPTEDIRFVFQRDNFLRKGSTTRYSQWCDKHNFKWAIGLVPEEWINE